MAILPAAEALRHRNFRLMWGARMAGALAMQMQAVSLAWIVYDRARQTMGIGESAFLIGMIGLVQFVPILVLSLFAGIVLFLGYVEVEWWLVTAALMAMPR